MSDDFDASCCKTQASRLDEPVGASITLALRPVLSSNRLTLATHCSFFFPRESQAIETSYHLFPEVAWDESSKKLSEQRISKKNIWILMASSC
jgi:hypothetical protein